MKLRYKILYMSFGAGLVVLGMMLNSLVSGDAEAQGGVKDARFGYITCKGLYIKDGYKNKGAFGLSSNGGAILQIFGDDGETLIAYLGENAEGDNEIMFQLNSKNDVRQVSLMIGTDGGRFDSINKLGERVATIGVDKKGDGLVDLRDHHGYRK